MAPRMTLAEIELAYPREWVVAIDLERDGGAILKEGVVVFHSRDRAAARNVLDLVGRPAAFWYVGRRKRPADGLLGLVL